jgi:hypothetical protein
VDTRRTLPEIEADLRALVERWGSYAGTEKAGAQTFLNQLVAAYTGAPTVIEAGASFEHFGTRDEGSGFMDLYWPGVVIVEMKAPKESRRLDTHRAQVLDYWRNSADAATDTPAPPHLVLCSFRAFEVWEPGKYPIAPRDTFTLEELPSRAEALMFLAGGQPVYGGPGAAVTEKAAAHMVDLYFLLLDREAAPPAELRRFIIQAVWVLFAEDLGLLPEREFEHVIKALGSDPTRNTAAEIADLMRRLDTEDNERRNRGRSTPLPYVNGALFSETPDVPLEPAEVDDLIKAAAYDWRWVNPTVFGSLLEGCLGHDHRWELGAHYTSEEDILSIVRPVIVRPWLERIEQTTDINEALHLLNEFVAFRVLDPAMGCANFLAIAYRELRAIERQLHAHVKDLHEAAGLLPPIMPLYPITNLYGIEIDPFAVQIAKATLWMTHALIARQYGAAEPPLPLPALDHLVCADSLKADWPEVEAIIGNPPFHGDRRLRSVVGDEYIEWLKDRFGVGVKDHCVYFFRKTHENLKEGQRAGLVATNTISQAKNRDASLVWITENDGTIVEAVSTTPWSGDAAVHVSIVCWQRGAVAEEGFLLDGIAAPGITPSLTAGFEHRAAARLRGNRGMGFNGYFPNGQGFVLTDDEADALFLRADADYRDVVFRFLNGDDLVSRPGGAPSRWIINFGTMSLEQAGCYPEALDIVRRLVKPVRDTNRRKSQRERWWQFAETRPGLTAALPHLNRCAMAPVTAKRWLPSWGDPTWKPSHAVQVFAFDDDYLFGVIASRIHEVWARANGSTLEDRMRYSTSTCFDTFPFPSEPPPDAQKATADAAVRIVAARREATAVLGKGLTAVYNKMDEGAFAELRAAHAALDRAVLDCYGLPHSLLDDEPALLDALFDLNEAAAANPDYAPFAARTMDDDTP